MFSKELDKKLDEYHLLKHPFYKSWNEGKLTREIIKDYAEQYYQHVKAFPRYISAAHSLCESLNLCGQFVRVPNIVIVQKGDEVLRGSSQTNVSLYGNRVPSRFAS